VAAFVSSPICYFGDDYGSDVATNSVIALKDDGVSQPGQGPIPPGSAH